MTVAAKPAVEEHLEDGVTLQFSAPFRFKAATDLIVERLIAGLPTPIVLVLGADYTVAGGATDAGGTVTRTAATNGGTLRIRRRTARAQPMIYNVGDRFPAKSHEEALDRGILIAQEIDADQADTASRALMALPGQSLAPIDKAAFVGRFFAGGPTGDIIPARGVGTDSGLRVDLAVDGGPIVGLRRPAPGAVAYSLDEHVAAVAFPHQFRRPGAANPTGMLQDMFASGRRVIIIPEGDYLIREPITIPPETYIIAPNSANFIADADDLTMFRTVGNTFGTQWKGGRFFGNDRDDVTAFDLTGFRHAAEIQHTWMQGLSVGINVRELCWDTALRHNFMIDMVDGIIVGQGSNAVTIDHPGISGFSSVGITLKPGTGPLPTVGNRIMGGYVQGGPVGVLDQARGTIIDATYFEECSDADISWSGASFGRIVSSYHSSTGGRVCVQGRQAKGCEAYGVVLQGDRTIGLFDFPADAGNEYCRSHQPRTATDNLMLGNTQTLHMDRRVGGSLEAGDVGWDGARKIYGVLGTGPGSFIQRAIGNGFDDIAVAGDTQINALQKAARVFKTVAGGEAFTFTNLADGQTITLMLRFTGAGTSAITVAGTPLDMSGAAAGKRKTVTATMNAADNNAVWVDEGPWK